LIEVGTDFALLKMFTIYNKEMNILLKHIHLRKEYIFCGVSLKKFQILGGDNKTDRMKVLVINKKNFLR